MAQLTAFGKEVNKKLIDCDKNQAWLIDRVRETTGLYVDSSYIRKILTGQKSTPKIVAAIREVLDLKEVGA